MAVQGFDLSLAQLHLVGGLDYFLLSHILGIITPMDFQIFRGVGQPPTSHVLEVCLEYFGVVISGQKQSWQLPLTKNIWVRRQYCSFA